jgi:hypothetical protein
MNTEAQESPVLEEVTQQLDEDTADREDLVPAAVNCRVSELATAL